MYRGIDLKIEDRTLFEHSSNYSSILDAKKTNISTTFKDILMNENQLDAEKIIQAWFPSDRYDVFISHSHKDKDLANDLANWLYEKFSITSFIDSHVWGYANKLLQELNNEYARKDSATYHYEPAMSNAANVYLMLSTALSEMIEKSECLLFINTENTLRNIRIKDSQDESRTASPWIMHELKVSSLIEKKLVREALVAESFEKVLGAESIGFSYNVSTNHLIKADEKIFQAWLDDFSNSNKDKANGEPKQHIALDTLYQIIDKLEFE
ncbi:TPA: hypothetical protein NJ508_004214 [Vibrio parahaemolyticus]|nr:hypothetical protein [Vibrio parahaemolyticus]